MVATRTAPLSGDDAWRHWSPGLDNHELTLGEVYRTLPGFPPEAINFIVRLFENPASPVAFPGAATLEAHDCLHILLGRGLLAQDEAFVIGFSMGTAKRIWSSEVWLFKQIARRLYPDIYKLSARDLKAFDIGFGYGAKHGLRNIAHAPFQAHWDMKLGALRRLLGIDVPALRAAYRLEQRLIPDSIESRRLPVAPGKPGAPRTPERLAA
jgi:hypothetical protein